MNRRHLGVVAIAALASSATVAVAAETDTFRGHTEGSFFTEDGYRPARISFERTGNRVHDVRFEIRVRCPSGQHRSKVGHIRGPLPISANGRFAGGEFVVGTPKTVHAARFERSESMRGRIRGDRASGTVGMAVTLDGKGRESGNGRLCKSGEVEWDAAAP
jgi:hypothetical protein